MSDEAEHESAVDPESVLSNEQVGYDEYAEYEKYIEQRNSLFAHATEQSNLFDTQLLTISAATLGFSVAFIEKIVPLKAAVYITGLYASWVLLLISTLLTLASFKIAERVTSSYQRQLDEYYDKYKKIKYDLSSRLEKVTTLCNWVSLAAFYAGVVCLCVFITLNLMHKS